MLSAKLTAEEKERRSTKAGLKNAQDQAKEECKKLQYVEIELVMAKEVAWTAQEVVKASE